MQAKLDIPYLFRHFRWRIVVTWLFVLLENTLMALIPLFIGRAIDGLLANQDEALWEVSAVMGLMLLVAVARRVYDTRAYGTMRVHFGAELVSRSGDAPVSRVNARLDMSREMVDFLEGHVPELLTAIVQVVVSIVILWAFDARLGVSAVIVVVTLAVLYGLFHERFYRLNSDLNSQTEKQVAILDQRERKSLLTHLQRLRRCEVRLSDTEAVLYGGIFTAMFAFVLMTLSFASTMTAITAGVIFTILSYSWELVESGVALPMALQQWTRLSEIRERLNEPSSGSAANAGTA